MFAEWSAECGADDPIVVVPWSDPEGRVRFVDLRAEPFDIADIPEAEDYPAMRRALRSLNASGSGFFTSKCDAWALSPEDGEEKLEALRIELELLDEEAAFGFGSYIDILWRERSTFASAHQASGRLDRLVRRTTRLPHPEAALEAVLRPAIVAERSEAGSPSARGALEGFAATLYITAVAADPETAMRRWEAALEAVVDLLREREQALPPGSATID